MFEPSEVQHALLRKKVWIDLDNSPHVPFFRPIIDELRARGYDLFVTARDAYQVRELLEYYEVDGKVVGKHYGKHKILKALGTCWRAAVLTAMVRKEKPDISVCHGSRGCLITSKLLKIPNLTLADYEFTAAVPSMRPTWLIFPSIVPDGHFKEGGPQILKYPGIKEDVYLARFKPDPKLKSRLGILPESLVVTVRPPATEAHYHNPEAEVLLKAALQRFVANPETTIILLPRNKRQGSELSAEWREAIASHKILIPDHVEDGMNLIWNSDLVISGGGTMNREAAALRVPVYSIFRGKIGAVDRYLADTGRLVLLTSVEDVRNKIVAARRQKSIEGPGQPHVPALETIVQHIEMAVSQARSQQPAVTLPQGSAALEQPESADDLSCHVEATARKLLAYCRKNDWAGYDPYDALNSRLFKALPLLDSRLPRLAFTQVLKRSPINVRSLALVPKTQNPKAIALFLSALLKLRNPVVDDREDLIDYMIDRLIALRSSGTSYWSWGYSFPWQGRSILVPAGAPNLVCTTFVAGALLDAYEQQHDERCLTMALGAADYILNELYWTDGAQAGFSYPMPGLGGETYNANLLAAALFCRVYRHTGDNKFLDPALRVARQAVRKQRPDGSWFYGDHPSQRWIDNFHTGYNLEALQSIGRNLKTDEFDGSMRRGFEFFRAHFFREDAAPKYFHDRLYPVDIHCVAQSIITLCEFRDLDPTNSELAHSVYAWAMKHMWDDRGFFYYRRLRLGTIRTSYMRWSQAWMLRALSELLSETDTTGEPSQVQDPKAVVQLC
jgi:predicted glycosyltransferase